MPRSLHRSRHPDWGHPSAHRRGAAAITAATLLLAPAAGCGGGSREAAPATTVRFAFFQVVDHLPYVVMGARGLAARHGLRLVEKAVSGGPAALEAMRRGEVDASYVGSVPVIRAALAGTVPGAAVAVGANNLADSAHPSTALVVGSAVRSWEDLAGRDVAANQVGSISEVAARIRLAREGVAGVRFVEIDFPNQGLALAGGNVAGAVLHEPFLTQSRLRGDGRVLAYVIGAEPFPEFLVTFVVLRAGFVADNPEAAKGFLRAHLDAVAWIAGHEGEARQVLAQRLGLDDRVAAAMSPLRFAADARVDAGLLDRMQATLAEADPALASVPAERVYDETLLREVLGIRG